MLTVFLLRFFFDYTVQTKIFMSQFLSWNYSYKNSSTWILTLIVIYNYCTVYIFIMCVSVCVVNIPFFTNHDFYCLVLHFQKSNIWEKCITGVTLFKIK